MHDFPSRLQQALNWHAEGELTQAWTVYEQLAQAAQATPVYSLALTVLALQTGQAALARQGLQRFLTQAPTARPQVASVLQLPVLLWPAVLFYFKTGAFTLLPPWPLALAERLPHLPPVMAAQAQYLQLLLGFVLQPTHGVQAARDFLQRQGPLPLPMAPQTLWAHAARAEVLRYLRHHHGRGPTLPLAQQIENLQQEIAHGLQAHERAVAYDLLARLYLMVHQESRAQQAFVQAAHCEPTPFRQLQQALCHDPLLPHAPAAIEAEYQRLWHAVEGLTQPLFLEQILSQAEGGLFTLFDWNYVHPQDHLLRQHHGRRFQWQHPLSALPPVPAASGRALGIVVTPGQEGMFYFAHHVLLRQLRAEVPDLRLHLITFAPHAIWDHLQAVCPGLQVHGLSSQWGSTFYGPGFYQQMMAVRQWGLQWVYFWEVGTDALSFLLPFFRLAPVQWTSWGSVSSTGHPAIDAFLTTPLLTPPELASAQFTERCVYLPQMSVGFLPEELPEVSAPRVPEATLCRIGCLHTPRKNSAAFLAALATIITRHLQAYPERPVQLVMIESANTHWQQAFAQRVRQALGEHADCVQWLSRLSPTAFDETLARMDFLLDAFPFGGGKLAYDSLRYGVPMVTLQGTHLRGRIPSCFYTELAIYDAQFAVATSVDAYIATALQLIQQPELRQSLRDRILKARHHLTRRALARDFCTALEAMLCR